MIRRLTISNFLALSARTFDFDKRGALIEGGNGRGKSTVLKAIKAALDGAGISPKAVRKGETAAEILVDLDHDSVRRRITSSGTTVEVLTPDGATRRSPAAFVADLLGLALLDPLDLFLAKPKDRRGIVLRAVPCRATPEILAPALAGLLDEQQMPDVLGPDGFAGHGLDVVDQFRRWAEEKRLAAGRLVKDKERELAAAEAAWKDARTEEQAHRDAPAKGASADALWTATQAKTALDARIATAERTASYAAGRQKRAAELRAEAAAARCRGAGWAAPTPEQERRALEAVEQEQAKEHEVQELHAQQEQAVHRLEELLRTARARLGELAEALAVRQRETATAQQAVVTLRAQQERAQAAAARAADLEAQARREDQAADELAGEQPTAEERQRVAEALAEAMRQVQAADAAEAARAKLKATGDAADVRAEELRTLRAQHTALDVAVKKLRDDVPRWLLGDAGSAFPGLTITGDTILVDDGTGAHVDVELLSTAAQMRFALNVAKALNAKSKLLLVDGLERIEPERRREFVAMAIEGGYQLFATRVTEGPLTISPITEGATR